MLSLLAAFSAAVITAVVVAASSALTAKAKQPAISITTRKQLRLMARVQLHRHTGSRAFGQISGAAHDQGQGQQNEQSSDYGIHKSLPPNNYLKGGGRSALLRLFGQVHAPEGVAAAS